LYRYDQCIKYVSSIALGAIVGGVISWLIYNM
jgi:hypothetical protein